MSNPQTTDQTIFTTIFKPSIFNQNYFNISNQNFKFQSNPNIISKEIRTKGSSENNLGKVAKDYELKEHGKKKE